ncbi:MAG: hypothetical protein IPM81_18455 [Saprospirales bacterium]|nr:hypothetical protein [Saprospirales bacterium]
MELAAPINNHRHRRQKHLTALATGIDYFRFTDFKRIGSVGGYWPTRIPVLYLPQYLGIQFFDIWDFVVPDIFAMFIGKGSIAKFPAQEIVD